MRDTGRTFISAVEAAFWLAAAGVLLRLIPLSRLFRELPPGAPAILLSIRETESIERVRWAIGGVAALVPWRPRCLPKALAGVLMCRVRGLKIPIALGVTSRGGFAAHARLDGGSDLELALASPEGRTHLGRLVLAI